MSAKQLAEKIALTAIESSNLAAVGYNEAKKILAVQFKGNGQIFHYAGVSVEDCAAFFGSDSLGRYYSQNIRGKLQAERMTGPCEKCGAEGWIGERCDDCGTADHVEFVRCDSKHAGASGQERACVLARDHDGDHRNGKTVWQ